MQNELSRRPVLELHILELNVASLRPVSSLLELRDCVSRSFGVFLDYLAKYHAPVRIDHVLLHQHEGPKKLDHGDLHLE